MRVISDFKDYYDISIQNGIDPNLIFKRKEGIVNEEGVDIYPYKSEIESTPESLKTIYQLARSVPSYSDQFLSFIPIIIGFCGKFYLIYQYQTISAHRKQLFFYSAEKVCEFVEKNNLLSNFNATKRASYFSRAQFRKIEIFNAYSIVSSFKNNNVFIDLNVPIIVSSLRIKVDFFINFRNSSLWHTKTNIKLSDIGFNHVVDPFTAFQELSMFIGGVLGSKEKEIADIPDLYKIGQKGFDIKKSFRKEPSTLKGY